MPIGGAKPKFSTATNGLIVSRVAETQLAMACPGQGFPVPSYRLGFLSTPSFPAFRWFCRLPIQEKNWGLKISFLFSQNLEPIGSAKPQLSGDTNLKGLNRHQSEQVALTCPAQGFPTPGFRLVVTLKGPDHRKHDQTHRPAGFTQSQHSAVSMF